MGIKATFMVKSVTIFHMFVTSFHVYGYFQYYTIIGLYASGKNKYNCFRSLRTENRQLKNSMFYPLTLHKRPPKLYIVNATSAEGSNDACRRLEQTSNVRPDILISKRQVL